MIALPWWLFLVLALPTYFVVAYVLPTALGNSPSRPVIVAGVKPLAVFSAAGLVLLSLLVARHQYKARRLLDQQTGLDSIRAMSWQSFECLVAEAYRRQGYTVVENGGGGADGGIDLVADKGGRYLIQCKHWKTYRVGVKEIRELFGLVAAEHAKGGVFATTGTFTPDALAFAKGKPLELLDGVHLAAFVRSVQQPGLRRSPVAAPTAPSTNFVGKHADAPPTSPHRPEMPGSAPAIGVPATPFRAPAVVASVDTAMTPQAAPRCPQCGGPMVRRTARKAMNAGKEFWGCAQFPRCRGTSDIR